MYTVVLGLGSNVGQKLDYLRQAIVAIAQQIGKLEAYSPIYQTPALLPNGAPSFWDVDYYNVAVLVKTELAPQSLLNKIKSIETQLGRDPGHVFWSPREIDIDILSYEGLVYQSENLQIPHKDLLVRNFALQPLLDVLPSWQHPTEVIDVYEKLKTMPELSLAPFSLSGSQIMAIINLSADSFSSNGESIISLDSFEQYIIELVKSGAEVVDLGAESTMPMAQAKSAEACWEILAPYLQKIDQLIKTKVLPISLKVSIDTYHAQVVEKALAYDCLSIVNDVYGVESTKMAALLVAGQKEYVFMHQLGPAAQVYLAVNNDPVAQFLKYAKDKMEMLIAKGFAKTQLVFDVGIGFGKRPYQAKLLLEQIDRIQTELGIKVLVGHSRKSSVISPVSKQDNFIKDIATAILSRELIKKEVDYLRVHNVELTKVAKQL